MTLNSSVCRRRHRPHPLLQFLTEEAKKSNHRFPDEASEAAALIWQYPVFAAGASASFVQSYIADF